MIEKNDIEEQFYSECSKILGVQTEYTAQKPLRSHYSMREGRIVTRPTRNGRFTGRKPGNGRFVGFGTIRMYEPNYIHISLRYPVCVNKVFTSSEVALGYLRSLMEISDDQSCPMST